MGEFAVLEVSEATTLDFVESDDEIHQLHYAFLVTEAEFDEIFERIREWELPYWADPFRQDRDQINHWDGGRGDGDLAPGVSSLQCRIASATSPSGVVGSTTGFRSPASISSSR